MKWTETPNQVKGFFKRKDIIKWEIQYFPDKSEKKWMIETEAKPSKWEWIEKNVEYAPIA